jgi:CPA2 family monovalent cation:H+ antiporter-2
MQSQDFLVDVIVILLAAVVSAIVARQLKLPPIIGYLLAGAVIGPFSLGFVSDVGAIERVGGLGVVFLLFAVGLELPFDRLRIMRGGILSLGAAQFLVTGLVLALTAWAFGSEPSGAFIIGAALAMSSTAIVLQILIERREMNTQIGRSTLAVLLAQDLAVGPMLAIALAIGGDKIPRLDWDVALAVVEPVLGVILIIALGRLVLRPLFRPVAATRNFDIFSATTLLVILLIGWLTEKAGLSMAFGAFLAGLLLADTAYRHRWRRSCNRFAAYCWVYFLLRLACRSISPPWPTMFGSSRCWCWR